MATIIQSETSFFDTALLSSLQDQTPFFVFSKKALLHNLHEYQRYLPPKTEICYAMKANSERYVLQALNEAGASFEVASKFELNLLRALNVPAERIIYGTSVKSADHIQAFAEYGVDRFAFDSEQELLKIAKYAPNARVYVRALVDDCSESVFHLSERFGTDLEQAAALLLQAREIGLCPYGISFCVGSQAKNEYAWARGIEDVYKVIKQLLAKGIQLQAINIGGGFPHTYQHDETFPDVSTISRHIASALNMLPYQLPLITEPGRGLVANSFVLVASIIGKVNKPNGHWLYLDAGVYNACMEALTCQGSTKYGITPLGIDGTLFPNEEYIISGPTGDGLDVLSRSETLPSSLQVGDRLLIHDTGAYTFSLTTQFNGFPQPKVIML